jgi:predicted RND superfamily exporter protein
MSKKENVTVFGKDESRYQNRDYHDNSGIIWGVFLILIGIIFLLNNFGIVPWIIWNYIVGFWPIFIVFAGLQVILGNNFISRIVVTLLALVAFGFILIYSLYQVGSPLVSNLSPEIVNFIQVLDNVRR